LGSRPSAILRHGGPAANARRKASGKKEIPLSPIAIEIVSRIDALFAIERDIKGKSPEERFAVPQSSSLTLVEALESYIREQLTKLSPSHDLAKAIKYMLNRWHAFTLFLNDCHVCPSYNAAECDLLGIALGRKSWLFFGSHRVLTRAAAMYGLIVSARRNGVDPQSWLTAVFARIAARPTHRLDELLPSNWQKTNPAAEAVVAKKPYQFGCFPAAHSACLPRCPRGKGSNMGQFSTEKLVPPGLALSENQHAWRCSEQSRPAP